MGQRRLYSTRLKEYDTLYDLLETSPEATKTEIRENWLRLSMQYHPDLNKDSPEAQEKFVKIREAYKLLINDEQRSLYNAKIGFYHPDPPPEFQESWTLQSEKDKISARTYYALWDEKKIRDLMSSERLREVDWKNKAPSERYRILVEEERKQLEQKQQLEDSYTPPLNTTILKFTVIGGAVVILTMLAYRIDLIEQLDEVKELRLKMKPEVPLPSIELPSGQYIDSRSRVLQSNQTHYSYLVGLTEVKDKLAASARKKIGQWY